PSTTLRQEFLRDHALFTNRNRLPNKAVIHILVITKDSKMLLMQRSRYVKFQNAQWSATFEEQMQGDYTDEVSGRIEQGDEDFFPEEKILGDRWHPTSRIRIFLGSLYFLRDTRSS